MYLCRPAGHLVPPHTSPCRWSLHSQNKQHGRKISSGGIKASQSDHTPFPESSSSDGSEGALDGSPHSPELKNASRHSSSLKELPAHIMQHVKSSIGGPMLILSLAVFAAFKVQWDCLMWVQWGRLTCFNELISLPNVSDVLNVSQRCH